MVRAEFTDHEAAFLVQVLNSISGRDDVISIIKERIQQTDNDNRFDCSLRYWRKRISGEIKVNETPTGD